MTIKIIRALLFLLIFTLKFTFSLCAQQSVLSLGQWIKMSFQEQGVYSIDFNTLSQMGFDAADFNPNQIAIYSYPAGMLPQSNAIDRPTDLDENHIYIEGGEDGSFNSNYLILFYVKSPEKTLYNRATDSYEVIKNHHSESVHYYITLKNNNGLRIQQSPMSITQSPPIDWYREVILHELNEINLLRSGREWLGERFTNNTAQSFQFSANELRRDQSIKFQIKAAAQSFNSSTLNIELNNSNIGQIDFESIPNIQYGIKANLQEQIFTLDANSVSGNELVIELGYNQNSQNNAIAYLDKLTLDIPKNLALEEKPLLLRNSEMTKNVISKFRIVSDNSNSRIWDITQMEKVDDIAYTRSNSVIEFTSATTKNREFYIFDASQIIPAESFNEIENQNLKGYTQSEFFIITDPVFVSEAQRLADFRQSNDGLTSNVITTASIYYEFSSGRQDITAIRDFLKFHYSFGNLKYALLFGKGSYDYLDRLEDNTNLVPTYESRNSIHPLLSFSSDDYFGFLDLDEEQWTENTQGDHLLDIGIGKIPVISQEQAKVAIDKIVR